MVCLFYFLLLKKLFAFCCFCGILFYALRLYRGNIIGVTCGVFCLSFSSTVKNEICRMENSNNCCLLSELAAVIYLNSVVKIEKSDDVNIRIVTENAAFARRLFSIIKKLYNIYPEVVMRKSKKLKKHTLYILVITSSMGAKSILNSSKVLKKGCCKKAYLRGAFLAGGSISDPEKTYHLEITCHRLSMAKMVCAMINSFKSNELNAKVIKRKGNFIIYLKEGENIVDFLNIIGAHTALLELENVRILKGMRNSVNRIVNCETANLDKTINASMRQVENIKYIKDKIGFGALPENLREIAELRLLYPDANLKELGNGLNPALGKSGVNHRLRKLDSIAEKLGFERGMLNG